jgi:hypothetical protein
MTEIKPGDRVLNLISVTSGSWMARAVGPQLIQVHARTDDTYEGLLFISLRSDFLVIPDDVGWTEPPSLQRGPVTASIAHDDAEAVFHWAVEHLSWLRPESYREITNRLGARMNAACRDRRLELERMRAGTQFG